MEGEKGFCRAMVEEPHLEKLTEGLGAGRLKIDDNSFKPYACCKHSHAALYAIQTLRGENALRPEDVAQVKLYVNEITNYLINNPEPKNPYGCKFSIQYCAAAMLKNGVVGIEEFEPEAISDASVISLRTRVSQAALTAGSAPPTMEIGVPGRRAAFIRRITATAPKIRSRRLPISSDSPLKPMSCRIGSFTA